jgi:hypothetical protein
MLVVNEMVGDEDGNVKPRNEEKGWKSCRELSQAGEASFVRTPLWMSCSCSRFFSVCRYADRYTGTQARRYIGSELAGCWASPQRKSRSLAVYVYALTVAASERVFYIINSSSVPTLGVHLINIQNLIMAHK